MYGIGIINNLGTYNLPNIKDRDTSLGNYTNFAINILSYVYTEKDVAKVQFTLSSRPKIKQNSNK